MKQTNNLQFSSSSISPPQPKQSYSTQSKYIGNTNGLFSPQRAKSVAVNPAASMSTKHIPNEIGFQTLITSPVQHYQQLNLQQRPDLNAGYSSHLTYEPAQYNTGALNFYGNASQLYPRPGGVVPQPLPSQQQPVYQYASK